MTRTNPKIALLLWLTAAYSAGFVGSQGVRQGFESGMYGALAKPAWIPPGLVFTVVWSVLYVLIGVAAWRVWRTEGPRRAGLALWGFGLVLNAAWSWAFFGYGKLLLALGICLALLVVTLATVPLFARRDRTAAWLLLPYVAWLGFATVFNLVVLRMN